MNKLNVFKFSQEVVFSKVFLTVVLMIFCLNMLAPQTVLAVEEQKEVEPIFVIAGYSDGEILTNLFSTEKQENEVVQENEKEFKKFENKSLKVKKTYKVVATAYSSSVEQTDDTPCLTANGLDVCEHNKEDIIAANFLKFGTRVKIPEMYGEQIFTVADRMNPRYDFRIDLWKTSRERAIQFGIRNITIEVLD